MLFPFQNLVWTNVAFALFQSCNTSLNRFRTYVILTRVEEWSFIVDIKRGRISQTLRHRQIIFAEKHRFLSFLKSNIEARKRHSYTLCEMSFDFPLFKSLCDM